MKIKEVLLKGNDLLKKYDIDEYRLKTKLLLSNILSTPKEYLIIHDEEEVSDNNEKSFFDAIEKIKKGIPIQYIINKQEFMGIEFYVNENVLIPQPDTEILVQVCLDNIKDNNKVLDLCTGSGAIGISLSCLCKSKNIKVVLTDISEKAIDVARINCEKNNQEIDIVKSDLFENIKDKYDIIVSNPPYIETTVIKTLSQEVQNEPHIALDGGEDGLNFYRSISKNAKEFLVDNGLLALEIGYNQKEKVMSILKQDGYRDIKCIKDYNNLDRVITCKMGG